MLRTLKTLLLCSVGAAVFAVGALTSSLWVGDTEASGDESQAIPIRSDGSSIFADVAAKVRPAVVFIRTERNRGTSDHGGRSFDFFRELFPERQRERGGRPIPGAGSGFVIDTEGRVLTNYHVIKDANKITVVLGQEPDNEEYEAEVVGYDRYTDIAVIQIDADRKLETVKLGDSDSMRVGDWVMAIGTPFGQLQGTVTVGVVSATGRNDLRIVGVDNNGYQNYIQTDASINFGNSGGPLVNTHGEAIGINTAINPSGQGIGFAIPINMAKNIMAQLIEEGRVRYGFMGIQLRELDETMAKGLGLEVEEGILVQSVLDGTPAAKGGMQQKDVIVEYNGERVRDDASFRLMVGNTPVGTKVPVKVVRDGKNKDLTITIAERPDEDVVAEIEPSGGQWLGLMVDDAATRDARRRFGTERGQDGVVVLEVEEGSPADMAGIREGDVITEVYSQSVARLEDYVKISEKLKDRKDPIAFLVKRGRSTTYIPVIPDKR